MGNIHFKWGIFNSSREYSLKVGNIHFNWGIFTSTGEYSLQLLGNIHFKWGIFTCSKSRESLLGCREFAPRGGGRSVDGGKLIPWSCHIQNITSHTYVPAIFKILYLTLMFLPYLKYYIRHSWSCHIQNILSRTYGPAIFRRSDHTSHDNFKLRALFQRNQNSFPTSDPSPVSELCT